MGKIGILPKNLANQIAAGEVVERPASVVKELVENALDAGATRISVGLEEGGRAAIVVEDDGEGMSREDAILCIERHATSKVREVADLFRIGTLGFRGEALPSIASVSKLSLLTAPRGGGEGTRVVVNGGRTVAVEPASCSPGTSVRVEELFFNVPARRKFLKVPATELTHALRVMVSYALANPEVAFTVHQDGREVLGLPAESDLRARAAGCLGRKVAGEATLVSRDLSIFTLRALLPPLSETRANRDGQYVFVNRRLVRDRLVSQALYHAYDALVPKGRHPWIVLFLEMDPERVDVNVHPTKAEVRLADARELFGLLSGTLRRAWQERGDVAPLPARPQLVVSPLPTSGLFAGLPVTLPGPASAMERPGAAPPPHAPPHAGRAAAACAVQEEMPEGAGAADVSPADPPALIGQFRRTFLVASDAAGLLLIDQHVAHERILYERTLEALSRDRARQPLLVPELVELSADRAARLRALIPSLAEMGLVVDELDGAAFAVREVPATLAEFAPGAALRELLDGEARTGSGAPAPLQALRHELAARIACKGAIKARRSLTPREQLELVAELWRCESRWHCPHGRPIMLRIDYDQIARHFERR